ncbi:FGGY-family carbohydrate kinase [Serratia ureilytica]
MIAGFCSSTNGWLPLICTMNVTSATTAVQTLLDQDLAGFNALLAQASPGAGGVEMLPFFNGERVPPLPHARQPAQPDSDNTRANLCLAVVESATYGLRYGIELFRRQGIEAREIRLTGGGARSAAWRQIVADVMGCPVVCLKAKETAALGGAIQAMWATMLADDPRRNAAALLAELCQRFVALDEATRTAKRRRAGAIRDALSTLPATLAADLPGGATVTRDPRASARLPAGGQRRQENLRPGRGAQECEFCLRRGSIHALCGGNGAGKSTFLSILMGFIQPDGGDIFINGQRCEFHHPREALNAGIAIVQQELSAIPDLTVAENIWLGREPRRGVRRFRNAQPAHDQPAQRTRFQDRRPKKCAT